MLTHFISHEIISEFPVCREIEISEFPIWSDNPHGFYFHTQTKETDGKGGIGKTWLLHKYSEIARQSQAIVAVTLDFFNRTDKRPLRIEKLLTMLSHLGPHWQREAFCKPLTSPYVSDWQYLDFLFAESDETVLILCDTYEMTVEDNLSSAVSQWFSSNHLYRSRQPMILTDLYEQDSHQSNWQGHGRDRVIVPILLLEQQARIFMEQPSKGWTAFYNKYKPSLTKYAKSSGIAPTDAEYIIDQLLCRFLGGKTSDGSEHNLQNLDHKGTLRKLKRRLARWTRVLHGKRIARIRVSIKARQRTRSLLLKLKHLAYKARSNIGCSRKAQKREASTNRVAKSEDHSTLFIVMLPRYSTATQFLLRTDDMIALTC